MLFIFFIQLTPGRCPPTVAMGPPVVRLLEPRSVGPRLGRAAGLDELPEAAAARHRKGFSQG